MSTRTTATLTTSEPGVESLDLPIVALRADGGNVRPAGEDDSLEALTQSLAEHGMLHSIGVYADGEGWGLIFGHRRLEAARSLGWETIPARVFPPPASEADRILIQLTENVRRREIDPIAQAGQFAALHERHGMPMEAIARRMGGLSTSMISRYVALHRQLVPSLKDRVRDGSLSVAHAREIARLPGDEQEAFAARAARMTSEALAGAVARRVGGVAREAPAKPRRGGGGVIRLHSYEARIGKKILTLRYVDGRGRNRNRTPADYLPALEQLVAHLRGQPPSDPADELAFLARDEEED